MADIQELRELPAVDFEDVDIVFGDDPRSALPMLDAGASREEILEATGQVLGVAGADLTVHNGEICVLMGLSGSGKSTLLRAVNGLNKVTRGAVMLADGDKSVDVASCDAKTLRRIRMQRVAMVFQQFALLPWRTVAENVGLGLELRGMGREERRRIVAEKLKLVSLDAWAEKYAHELSGGMQQRVGLARAFATDAEILLMDEPFSALDPLIRSHLQDELLELQRSLKKTIVFVSHDLDEALKIGTRIAIMEGGRIVQVGAPEEIVLAPANDYVAAFVRHMNPLNVLRGASVMRPVERLSRNGRGLALDEHGILRAELDDKGHLEAVSEAGRKVPWAAIDEEAKIARLAGDEIAIAPTDISLRNAIECRQATGRPVLLAEQGRLVGIIGEPEILEAILRRAEAVGAQSPEQSSHQPTGALT